MLASGAPSSRARAGGPSTRRGGWDPAPTTRVCPVAVGASQEKRGPWAEANYELYPLVHADPWGLLEPSIGLMCPHGRDAGLPREPGSSAEGAAGLRGGRPCAHGHSRHIRRGVTLRVCSPSPRSSRPPAMDSRWADMLLSQPASGKSRMALRAPGRWRAIGTPLSWELGTMGAAPHRGRGSIP